MPDFITTTLTALREHKLSVEEALHRLADLPFQDLGYARIDHHRILRQGFPEAIFGQGKTPDQIAAIAAQIAARQAPVVVTRAASDAYIAVKHVLPEAEYHQSARVITWGKAAPMAGQVAVVSAGTSDLSVAEEAAVCLESMGYAPRRIYDVGVAGIHRLFQYLDDLRAADVVIVVAGMEGALASVVGGLLKNPVVAVPTSVGYGANFQGLAPLLSMLNSCAAGVGVVNIDNGYGAAALAGSILGLKE